MGRVRRTLGITAAIPVAVFATLAAQVRHARRNGTLIPETDLGIDGRIGPPHGDVLHMAWLGDSTAAGIGSDSADTTVARRVAQALQRPVELQMLGWSGARVADVRSIQVRALPARCDLVCISVGANDVTHFARPSTFRREYEAALDAIPHHALVVMLGCPDFSTSPRLPMPLRALAGWYSGVLDREVRSLATERGNAFVNIHGDPNDEFHRNPEPYFAADGFHPNDDGYRLWAEAVTPVVQSALTNSRRF
ncbi:MAG: SGNH/GDSL hydrolase family protein [Acidimicrobiia bacterium]